MKKTLRKSLFWMACLSVLFAKAQDRSVTGKVTSLEDGSAMPGVSITVKGTTRGANTDSEGNYRIATTDNAKLVFSFVGFSTVEVEVGNRSVINVQI